MRPKVNQPNWIQVCIFGIAFLILIGVYAGVGNQKLPEYPTAKQIATETNRMIVIPKSPTCPTAGEIVDLIELPKSENVAGWQDFFEDYFGEEYSELKDNAYEDVITELEEDDYEALEEFLNEAIEGFDELEDVNEDEDETEITITNLGLEEDEDKEAKVYLELNIKYTLKEGETTRYKDTVMVYAKVLYDEGDLDDEDVEIEYSL